MHSHEHDTPGLDFSRYALGELIGEGSAAWVYRAYDPLAHRAVAVKVLKPSARETCAGGARLRFFREAEAAGRLTHPHIVTIYDVTADIIVMEFLEGTNLEEHLRRQGGLPLDAVMSILHPLADALDYAHHRGIVHRDVKPGNIMVSPGGRPTLTDFGVAHLGASGLTIEGEFLGSPSYMAPEQVEGGPVSPRADVFSLAAVAYEMATGTRAFAGSSVPAAVHSVLLSTPPPPSHLRSELPASFDAAILRGLSKNPLDRYASAGELSAAIDPLGFERTQARISRGDVWSEPASSGADAPGSAGQSVPRRAADAETQDLGLTPKRATRLILGSTRLWVPVAMAGTAIALAAGSTTRTPPSRAESQVAEPAAEVQPTLRLETEPSGASVWIDERRVGESPLTSLPLAPGMHAVIVDRPGFATARLQLAPRTSARTTTVRVSLHPRLAVPLPSAGVTFGITRPQGEIESSHATAPNQEVLPPQSRRGELLPPRRLTGEPPLYPSVAVEVGLQGTVVVEMTITAAGEVVDVHVVESAGDVLDGAVLAAVATWRYSPAVQAGAARAVRWRVRQRFSLHR